MGRVDLTWRELPRGAVLHHMTLGAAMDPTTDEFHDGFDGVVRSAEVLSIFFPRVGQSLILDMRRAGDDGPVVLLDGMVASPNDRFRSFDRLSPELPLPEQLILAPWPGSVDSFHESGLLDAIVARCQHEGGEVLVDQMHEIYRELWSLERRHLRNMARGIDTETIWKRQQ